MSTKTKAAKTTKTTDAAKDKASNPATALNYIPIIVARSSASEDDGWGGQTRGAAERINEVVDSTVRLAKEKVAELCGQLDQALVLAEQKMTMFTFDKLEVNLEVTAKGEIGIKALGSAEASGSGSIKLTLKRK